MGTDKVHCFECTEPKKKAFGLIGLVYEIVVHLKALAQVISIIMCVSCYVTVRVKTRHKHVHSKTCKNYDNKLSSFNNHAASSDLIPIQKKLI